MLATNIENPRVGGSIPPQATTHHFAEVQRRPAKSQKPLGINALGLFVVRERPQSSGLNQSLLQ